MTLLNRLLNADLTLSSLEGAGPREEAGPGQDAGGPLEDLLLLLLGRKRRDVTTENEDALDGRPPSNDFVPDRGPGVPLGGGGASGSPLGSSLSRPGGNDLLTLLVSLLGGRLAPGPAIRGGGRRREDPRPQIPPSSSGSPRVPGSGFQSAGAGGFSDAGPGSGL